MFSLKTGTPIIRKALFFSIVIELLLLKNVWAETYEFVSKIPPSQQYYFYNPERVAVDSSGDV